jgi:hypothetical protein
VQELGIGVGQNAGDVRLDGVEQPEQDRRGRLAGGLGGGDDRVDLVGVVARPTADGAQRLRFRGRGGRLNAGGGREQPGGGAGGAGVAPDLGDLQPAIDARSTSRRTTVLPSSFSSRWVVVVLVTVTTGSRARGSTRSPIRAATGPSGRSDIRCGRVACQPITGWVVAAGAATLAGAAAVAGAAAAPAPGAPPAVRGALGVPGVRGAVGVRAVSPESSSSPPRDLPAYSRVRPARCSRQSNVSSQVRRQAAGLPPRSGMTPKAVPRASSAPATTSSRARASSPAAMKPARPGVTSQLLPGDVMQASFKHEFTIRW